MQIIKPHNRPSEQVKKYKEIKNEIKEMKELLEATDLGVALAHAQVSETPKNFFIVRDKFKKFFNYHTVIINPKILYKNEKTMSMEGCLSFPYRKPISVVRFNNILIQYVSPCWVGCLHKHSYYLKELPAYIFQHEYDHCQGIDIYNNRRQ